MNRHQHAAAAHLVFCCAAAALLGQCDAQLRARFTQSPIGDKGYLKTRAVSCGGCIASVVAFVVQTCVKALCDPISEEFLISQAQNSAKIIELLVL
jgi:hypothetical protein